MHGLQQSKSGPTKPEYYQLSECVEEYFAREGDSPLGMGWPNIPDAIRRYHVMLELIRESAGPVSLLDFGCGTGHLYEHIQSRSDLPRIDYHGLDLSPNFVDIARRKFPDARFTHGDVLQDESVIGDYDYAVINGVFTSKRDMSFETMLAFVKRLVKLVAKHVRTGLAFNAISKQVDWERDDLFHLPLDTIAWFLCTELGRDFVIRNDYGLYEFTVYSYPDR